MSTLKELYEISWKLHERIKLGLGEDEWYGTDTHDVNVYVWGNKVKAVAYRLREDMAPDYSTSDTLWIETDITNNEENAE